MTFAPRACASEMIDLPLPGSRSTSRMTFAPFVSACSACVRCVPGSPWAFVIVCLIPAAVKAWSRYLRSNCSQRTDDCVSGRSTAMLPFTFEFPLDVLAPALVEVLLLLDDPQPAATSATITATAARPHHIFLGTSYLLLCADRLVRTLLNDKLSAPLQIGIARASPPHCRPHAPGE